MILKTWNFNSNLGDIHKNQEKISIVISVFDYKSKKNYPIYVSKSLVKKHVMIFYWYEKKTDCTMLLSKNLMQLLMMIHYIMEKKPFSFITLCKRLLQKKYQNFKNINGKQRIKIIKKGKKVRIKNYERKNHHLWFLQILKVF